MKKNTPSERARREAIQRVLPGFPAPPFEALEELEAELGGETILCRMCGKPYVAVLLHVRRTHEMSEPEYRGRFNIPWKYSLAGSGLSAQRSAHARRPEHIEHIRKQRAIGPHTGPLTPLGRQAKALPPEVLTETLRLAKTHPTVAAAARAASVSHGTFAWRLMAAKARGFEPWA